jgi:hypothetical protein
VSLWELLGTSGSLLEPPGTSESLCVPLETLGVSAEPLRISGSLWELLAGSGSLWELLGMSECLWEPLEPLSASGSLPRVPFKVFVRGCASPTSSRSPSDLYILKALAKISLGPLPELRL